MFGVSFDQMTFGGLERDTTGDFVPTSDLDLATVAATLAAGPGPEDSYNSPASLASHHKCSLRLRKRRPHRCVVYFCLAPPLINVRLTDCATREEHVKRLRISFDPFGDQDTKFPPYAVNLPTQKQPLATGSTGVATEARDTQAVTSGSGFFCRLCGAVRMLMREVWFGNESNA